MKNRIGSNLLRIPLAAILFSMISFTTGCSAYYQRTVVADNGAAYAPAENAQADEFIGTPIIGDYDDNPDLDFILEVQDGDQRFKIEVHEDVNDSNRELVEKIRTQINEMEDRGMIRVVGYYNSEFRGKNKEYGFLDMKMVVFFDGEQGAETAYFTDPTESRFYDQGDVTVIFAPGHRYNHVYYPRYTDPWWDSDGDGIPNTYDPWPLSYDVWYDYNLNGLPDWYDPYYCNYYPYWNHWDMGFWVSYGWYDPWQSQRYYHGYSRGYADGYWDAGYYNNYYNDYRKYTRLYDQKYVSQNPNRYSLNRETESRQFRNLSDAQKDARLVRNSSSSGYTSLPADNRMLVIPSATDRSRYSDGSTVTAGSNNNSGNNVTDTFTRNRVTTSSTTGGNDTRTRTTVSTKTKSSDLGAAATDQYNRVRSSSRTAGSSGTPARTSSSRSRTYSGSSSSSSDTRAYTPTSRSRSSSSGTVSGASSGSSTVTRSRSYRGSSGSSSSTVTPSRSRSSSSAAPSSAGSVSPSRSRSNPPASSPAASSSSSRSRSSGSSSSSRGSSGSSDSGNGRRR